MFRDAGQLLKLSRLQKAHAVSFGWMGFLPEFLVHTPENGIKKLGFERLLLVAGETKTCVGRFNEEGYIPCPGNLPVSGYAQCRACAFAFVPQPQCIFEPRCTGELCPDAYFCKREHKVYLAFFGRLPKIGMTSTRRLMRRVIEQGADAYAVVATLGNRKEARELEKRLGTSLSLRQNYRESEVLGELPNAKAGIIAPVYDEVRNRLESISGIKAGPVSYLDRYPVRQPISVPEPVEPTGIHAGEVLGVKGRYVIYENEGGVRALDLMDVIGRDVKLELSG